MNTSNGEHVGFDGAANASDRLDEESVDCGAVLPFGKGIVATGPERGRAPVRANRAKAARPPDLHAAAGAVEPLLTFAEAARVLGISLRQFRRLVDGGRVAFVKVSERTPRVRPGELQRFLAASVVKYSEVQT